MTFNYSEKKDLTTVKVSHKELRDISNLFYLQVLGFNIRQSVKESSRYIYYSGKGDLLS